MFLQSALYVLTICRSTSLFVVFIQSRYSSKGLTNAIIMWYPFGTLVSFKILVAWKCDRVRFMPLAYYSLSFINMITNCSGDLPENNTFNDNDHLADHKSPRPRDGLIIYPRHTPQPTQTVVEKILCQLLGYRQINKKIK